MRTLNEFVNEYEINEGQTWEKIKELFKKGWDWLLNDDTDSIYDSSSSDYDENEKTKYLKANKINFVAKIVNNEKDLDTIIEKSMPKDNQDTSEKGFVRAAKLKKDKKFNFKNWQWVAHIASTELIKEVVVLTASTTESEFGTDVLYVTCFDVNKLYGDTEVLKNAFDQVVNIANKNNSKKIVFVFESWIAKKLQESYKIQNAVEGLVDKTSDKYKKLNNHYIYNINN